MARSARLPNFEYVICSEYSGTMVIWNSQALERALENLFFIEAVCVPGRSDARAVDFFSISVSDLAVDR
jgi:hypothetical protein